jgi:type I restriction enzyme, S subunit
VLPPLDEQRAIAAFLDRETARIDALVAAKRRLIALLQERRAALIARAVTRGLDPDVRTKDSGVAWLGRVPAHWELKQLRHVGQCLIGLTYDPSEVVDADHGTLVLRSSNVQGGRIAKDDCVYVSRPIPQELRTQQGDLLICSRNGSRALIGKCASIGAKDAGLTFGAFMTVFRGGHNRYVNWILRSSLFDFQAGSFLTSTINQLTIANLRSFVVPWPPEAERSAIVDILEEATRRIESAILLAEQTVALLSEHRASLISSAVTGRIDVRVAA